MGQFEPLYDFLAEGDPPLAIQLLIFNTIVLIVLAVRRIRGSPALRADTYRIVQILLIIANFAILMESELGALLGIRI